VYEGIAIIENTILRTGRRVVYGASLVLYALGLVMMIWVAISTKVWSFPSGFGGPGSWQIGFENSAVFVLAAVVLPVLFCVLQLVPLGWIAAGQLAGAARIWSSVVRTQAALGIGSLTLWIALNTEDLGEGLVLHSKAFSLAALLAAGSLGAIITPVLQQVAMEVRSDDRENH